MSYIYPPLLKKELPSSKELIKVLMSAGQDEDEKRDTRPLMSVLMRLKKVDPRLSRHILRRKSLISGTPWDIVPFDKADTERAQDAKKRLQRVIERYFDNYIDSHMFGVGACKLQWDRSDSIKGAVPSISRIYKPYELEYNTRFERSVAEVRPAENNKLTRHEFEETEDESHLVNTYETDEHGGILRTILFYEYRLYESDKEWHRFIQLLKGILQGKYQDGAQPDTIAAGKEAVEQAVSHQAAFTSSEVDFEFHKITDAAGGTSINLYQERIIDAIEIAVTGTSSLASDRKRNAPTVQERAEDDIALWGRKGLASVINDQLITADVQRNLGENIEAPYEFSWSVQRALDPESMARMLETVSGFMDVPVSEVKRLCGVNPAKKDDVVIRREGQTKPQFSGFGG